MSNSPASDAGIGQAVFSTRVKLSIQASLFCFKFGALPGILIPLFFWIFYVSPQGFDMVKLDLLTKVSDSATYKKWRVRDMDGIRKVVTAITANKQEVQNLLPSEVKQALRPIYQPVQSFWNVVYISFFTAILGYMLTWWSLNKFGKTNQKNQRVRGSQDLVTSKILNKLVRNKRGNFLKRVFSRGDVNYKIVDVSLPHNAPMTGILVQGAQGSGKSLAIHDLMRQVFKAKRKSIIYDQSGEFFRAYYRPGKDFFFNPALEGSVPWSIFSELKNTYDADTMAQAFLPPKAGVSSGANAFFEDAARALFSVILLRLTQRGAVNTCDIATAFFEMPDAEMDELIKNSVASSAVGGDSKAQRQGVISSIAIYLNGIASVSEGDWSIREFLDREDDARFFILGTDDTEAMFSPLYRLILAVSFAVVAAKQEIVHRDKYWWWLDEVHTLGDIKLDKQTATIRKFGGCIVSGIQSGSQFITSMGKERGDTVMNCFNTVLMLRANEPGMMEMAAKRLGKVDMQMVSLNQTLAVTEWRDGAGMAKAEQEKWLVMPSEIGSLSDCEGFLKLVGSFPAARVNYKYWLPKYEGAACHVNQFKAVQDSPPRDQKFLIGRDTYLEPVDASCIVDPGSSSLDLSNEAVEKINFYVVSELDGDVVDISDMAEIQDVPPLAAVDEEHEEPHPLLGNGF